MSWTPTTFHRFTDETAFLAVMNLITGDTAHTMALRPIGVLYDTLPEGTPPVVLPGYHVNARWKNLAMPSEFAATRIYPVTPDEDFM